MTITLDDIYNYGDLKTKYQLSKYEMEDFTDGDYDRHIDAFIEDMTLTIKKIVRSGKHDLGHAVWDLCELIDETSEYAFECGYRCPHSLEEGLRDRAIQEFAEAWEEQQKGRS